MGEHAGSHVIMNRHRTIHMVLEVDLARIDQLSVVISFDVRQNLSRVFIR